MPRRRGRRARNGRPEGLAASTGIISSGQRSRSPQGRCRLKPADDRQMEAVACDRPPGGDGRFDTPPERRSLSLIGTMRQLDNKTLPDHPRPVGRARDLVTSALLLQVRDWWLLRQPREPDQKTFGSGAQEEATASTSPASSVAQGSGMNLNRHLPDHVRRHASPPGFSCQ